MKLDNCKTDEEKINWYINACIGYLNRFKENQCRENELAKAKYCIKHIERLIKD